MADTAEKTIQKRRNVPKERRREQLIKATISSVARRGFAGTTMADVTRAAGLSMGIINLHFQSKEKLLIETLRYLADEYETAWKLALLRSDPDPAAKLKAVINVDFSAGVCDRKKLAVWFAFWGEAKSRPTYSRICAESDDKNTRVVADLCQQITAQGYYQNADPEKIAITYLALSNGLWLDLLMTPDEINRGQACDLCLDYFARVFPHHF